MVILFELALICAGILLGITALDKWDGSTQIFAKAANTLKPFAAVIGGICLLIGIWFLFRPFCTFRDIIGILAGLSLLGGSFENSQSLQDFFNKSAAFLNPYKVIIGIIALILGILGLLNIAFIC
ncbi:hypothetical protein ACFSYG_16770 [Leeuwenhoekiella polynyae]|uniref:Uncharacterized protein n=1 Tax=Leeuwenhoekiella polynyae TaxID=1550906 RepID=A0A4Q0P159_9FLAO|nr:hypothetical protein [Leeuwenhoekiella polynyae]RXG20213.1 hypothetical protein DSM02_2649 [Leeuwenhoekiella polynyae]|tara:strand:- start:469 stop:843 length:375 start_codon:yes stop_codon:yes gene_type:complete